MTDTKCFRHGSTKLVWLGATLIGLVVSACGAASTPPGNSAAGGPMTITATQTSIGSVLAGPSGDTLYTLLSAAGTPLPCTAACLTAWPPLTASAGASIQAGSGVSATLAVDTSATQVSADGAPAYYFSGDTAPGQTNGEGLQSFGGTWYALQASGQPLKTGAGPATSTPAAASAPTVTPTPSGPAYGY